MDSITEQLATRDRLMREMARKLTPAERIERARQLQEQAMEELRANPEAWDRFYRRNLRKRAIDPRSVPDK